MAQDGRSKDYPRITPIASGIPRPQTHLDYIPPHNGLDARRHPPLQHHAPNLPHPEAFDRGHRPPPARFRSPSPRRTSWDRRDPPSSGRPPSPQAHYYADHPGRVHKMEEINRSIWDDVRPGHVQDSTSAPALRSAPVRPAPPPRDTEWSRNTFGSPSRSSHVWTPHDPWDPRDTRRAPLPPGPSPDWERRRTASWDDGRGPPRDLHLPPPRQLPNRQWEFDQRDPPRSAGPDVRWRREPDPYGPRPTMAEPMGFRAPPTQHRYAERPDGRYPHSPITQPSYLPSSSTGPSRMTQARDYGEQRRPGPPIDDARPLSRSNTSRSIDNLLNAESTSIRGLAHDNPPIKREPVDDFVEWRSQHPRQTTTSSPIISNPHHTLAEAFRPSSRDEYRGPRMDSTIRHDHRPPSTIGHPHLHTLPPLSNVSSPRVHHRQPSFPSIGHTPLQSPRPPSSKGSASSPPRRNESSQDPTLPPLRPLERFLDGMIPQSGGRRTPPLQSRHHQMSPRHRGGPPSVPPSPSSQIIQHERLASRRLDEAEADPRESRGAPPHSPIIQDHTVDIPQSMVSARGSDRLQNHVSEANRSRSPDLINALLPSARPETNSQHPSPSMLNSSKPTSSSNETDETVAVDMTINGKVGVNGSVDASMDIMPASDTEEPQVKAIKTRPSRKSRGRPRQLFTPPSPTSDIQQVASDPSRPKNFQNALQEFIRKRNSPDDGFDFEDVLARNRSIKDAQSSRRPAPPEHVIEDVITSRNMNDGLDFYCFSIRAQLLSETSERHKFVEGKAEKLKEKYRALNRKWAAHCAELDRQAVVEKDRTVKPTVPSTPVDVVPPSLPPAPSGRATRRTAGNIMADAVRSDLEFEQVMATLGNEDLVDPNVLSIRNAAVIPDMISVTPHTAYLLDVVYDDSNGIVDYPEQFYNVSAALGDWTEQEKDVFMDQFATYGKQFGKVAERLPHKTPEQCVLFYYIQKRTAVNFKEVVPKGTRGRRRKGFAKRQATAPQGKQKGNALLTDLRTRVDEEAAESPNGSPRPSDVDLPTNGLPGRRRRNGAIEDLTKTRSARASTRLRREVSPSTRESDSGDDNTPARESGAESDGDEEENGTPALDEVRRGKPRRARKPVQVADGSGPAPTRKRAGGSSTLWTPQEKVIFLEQLAIIGKNFAGLASIIGTKTAAQCRNYFQNNSKEQRFGDIVAQADARMKEEKLAKQEEKKKSKQSRDPSMQLDGAYDEHNRYMASDDQQPHNGTWPYGPQGNSDKPNARTPLSPSAMYSGSYSKSAAVNPPPSPFAPAPGHSPQHSQTFTWHIEGASRAPGSYSSPSRASVRSSHGDMRIDPPDPHPVGQEMNGHNLSVREDQNNSHTQQYRDFPGSYDERGDSGASRQRMPLPNSSYMYHPSGVDIGRGRSPPGNRRTTLESPHHRPPSASRQSDQALYGSPANHLPSVHRSMSTSSLHNSPPAHSGYPSSLHMGTNTQTSHNQGSYYPSHYSQASNSVYTAPPLSSSQLPPFGTKMPARPLQNDGGRLSSELPPFGSKNRLQDLPFFRTSKSTPTPTPPSPQTTGPQSSSPSALPPFGSKTSAMHTSPRNTATSPQGSWPRTQRGE